MSDGSAATAGAVHVCWTEPYEEVWRASIGERWCFRCRHRRAFELVVLAPIEMSYDGPHQRIECVGCGTVDGDLFPGMERLTAGEVRR